MNRTGLFFSLFILLNTFVYAGTIEVYPFARICPASTDFKVKADGKDIFVYQTSVGSFATFGCEGAADIEIATPLETKNIRVAPARHDIKAVTSQGRINFSVAGPVNLLVETEAREQLYLYINPIETDKPAADAPGVHFFGAGQVHEVNELWLKDNETLYIEGGAVVRGCVRATGAKNVRVAGYGVLDGSYYTNGVDGRHSIIYEGCDESRIENIVMIEPSAWMIVLGASKNIVIENVKELGNWAGTDGVDIVGSSHIRIKNCFFRVGDDAIVIKSMDMRRHGRPYTMDCALDVEDIEVSGCALQCYRGGQAFEIGHELRTNSISNIRFSDCDILGIHGFGAPFGIHNADRASITNVRYENIRVEHFYDKLIDLKIIESRWGKDTIRGNARNITFRNIDVTVSVYNPGYSCSLIGGFDAKHTIENVTFDNFRLNGKKVTNTDELDLYIKQAKNIRFK